MGYEHPMPVQEEVIPYLLGVNNDVVALAQTGTGKTAAYGLPVLQKVDASRNETQALILSPTRELCLQIADDLENYSKYLPGVRVLPVYGGANIEPQIRTLRKGVQVIVATPGRLIDLMERKAASLEHVENVVLDEADEMLSMGFTESIDKILAGVPENHNTLLFSATMSREIERISKKYLREAKEIVVGSRNEGAETVNHVYYMVHAKDKYLALKRIVDYYPKIYAIIFCRTRLETQEVADKLIQDGYNADSLHGDLSQQQRDLTMQKFRQHRVQFLVATDVAARGLDVEDLTHVINYGMPDDIENYTHRSGRTGRAGKKGTSICIVHTRERSKIREIEKVIGKEFVKGEMPSGKEICAKQLYKVIDDIERVEVDEEEIEQFLPEVYRKLEWLDKEDLIKRVVSREFGRFLQYYANAPEISEPTGRGEKGGKKGQRGGRKPEEGYTRLFLNVGKVDGFYAKEVMKLVNDHVQGKVEVGRIDLMKSFSFFEVPDGEADRVLHGLSGVQVKGRKVNVEVATGEAHEAGEGKSSRRSGRDGRSGGDAKGSRDRKKHGGGKTYEEAMSGKGKGKKGKDMGGKDNARKFASKREQTELARSLPSGSDFFKIPEEKQETDGTGLCEDGIVESRDFFAVIDGSTSKGTLRMDGKSSGRMAMEVLRASIPCLPKDADAATAAACLTSAIRHYYEVHGLYEEAARHAENRMTASAVVYSVHRHEVWMIGDCLCRFNGMTYTNPKPTDCILAGIRADVLRYLLRKGHSIADLCARDVGREWIWTHLKDQCAFQNADDAGPFGYTVLDGFPVDLSRVRVLPLPADTQELILASDGYPVLADTLEETERLLACSLAEDPLRIGEHPSTKGVAAGNESFDDRTYLRMKL